MTARDAIPPLLALAMLGVIGIQTSDALRRSGTWTPRQPVARAAIVDPYAGLDAVLAMPDSGPPAATLRDPFGFAVVRKPTGPTIIRPVVPTPAARPVVTAIVTGGDEPRAVLRYQGASYTVKPGDLFAQYRVISIDPDQVVVEDGRERFVLRRPIRGE